MCILCVRTKASLHATRLLIGRLSRAQQRRLLHSSPSTHPCVVCANASSGTPCCNSAQRGSLHTYAGCLHCRIVSRCTPRTFVLHSSPSTHPCADSANASSGTPCCNTAQPRSLHTDCAACLHCRIVSRRTPRTLVGPCPAVQDRAVGLAHQHALPETWWYLGMEFVHEGCCLMTKRRHSQQVDARYLHAS
jgi:hypothetical protein